MFMLQSHRPTLVDFKQFYAAVMWWQVAAESHGAQSILLGPSSTLHGPSTALFSPPSSKFLMTNIFGIEFL